MEEPVLTMDVRRLRAEPGGQAQLSVQVKNPGHLVESFHMDVVGLDPSWWQVHPPELAVYPGKEESAVVLLKPPENAQAPDEALIEVAHRELGEVLGSALPAPLAARVNRWGGALPQYGVGHVARVARARAVLPRRIALAGAAYDGVGIAACVRSGENAAEAVWHNTVESDPHE